MALDELQNYPQERQIIAAKDFSDETARIQNDLDEIVSSTVSLTLNNAFTGSNTFQNVKYLWTTLRYAKYSNNATTIVVATLWQNV